MLVNHGAQPFILPLTITGQHDLILEIPRDPRRCKEILGDPRRSKEIPGDARRSQEMIHRAALL